MDGDRKVRKCMEIGRDREELVWEGEKRGGKLESGMGGKKEQRKGWGVERNGKRKWKGWGVKRKGGNKSNGDLKGREKILWGWGVEGNGIRK